MQSIKNNFEAQNIKSFYNFLTFLRVLVKTLRQGRVKEPKRSALQCQDVLTKLFFVFAVLLLNSVSTLALLCFLSFVFPLLYKLSHCVHLSCLSQSIYRCVFRSFCLPVCLFFLALPPSLFAVMCFLYFVDLKCFLLLRIRVLCFPVSCI